MTPVLYRRDGPIARICLNRPEVLNAADAALAAAFRDACLAIEGDADVRVVVISGAGRAFMAGGDVAQFAGDAAAAIPATLIDPLHDGLLRLTRLAAPVVASLHSAVAGAGMSLAMACDLAIAADSTRFSFAYARLGASSDLGGSWHLPRLVGLRRAMAIALLGDTLDAHEALQCGLVNRVVAADQLAEATEALVQRLAAGAPLAQGLLKQLLRESAGRDLDAQLRAERVAFARCIGTQDFAEGVAAFRDRRAARFVGR